jgi:hypothetical protein
VEEGGLPFPCENISASKVPRLEDFGASVALGLACDCHQWSTANTTGPLLWAFAAQLLERNSQKSEYVVELVAVVGDS